MPGAISREDGNLLVGRGATADMGDRIDKVVIC